MHTENITDSNLGERICYYKKSNDYAALVDFLIATLASGGMPPKFQAKAFNELGLAHLQLNTVAEAEKAFLSAIEYDANNMNARFNNANLALYAQRYQEGLEQYLIILDKMPNHAGAQHHAGLCHSMTGNPTQALPFFEKSATLDSHAMGPHFWAGEILLQDGEFDKAFYYFNRALEITPDHPESRRGVAICLYEQGKYIESITHCDTLLLQGGDILSLRLKGDALLALHKTVEGAHCHISMALLDFDAQNYLIMRSKELEKHKPEQAKEYINILLEQFPELENALKTGITTTPCRRK